MLCAAVKVASQVRSTLSSPLPPALQGPLVNLCPKEREILLVRGGLGLGLKDRTMNINSQMAEPSGKLLRNSFQSKRICQYPEQGDHLM